MFTSMGFRINEVIRSFTFVDKLQYGANKERAAVHQSLSGWDLNEGIVCHFCLASATPLLLTAAKPCWPGCSGMRSSWAPAVEEEGGRETITDSSD